MARKIKYSPKHYDDQPGLFDIPADEPQPAPSQAEPKTPTPTDFDVNIAAKPSGAPTKASVEVDPASLTPHPTVFFMSFGSGSSGNCSYVGTRSGGFLIDAGVEPGTIRDALKANALSFDHIRGIILTHDHSDHVRYVYTIVRKHPHIGVYCTPKTLSGLLRRHSISRRIKDYHRPIYKEFPFQLADFEITPFEVSHDGTDNAGYFITHGTVRLAVATDLGCITPRVDHYMRQAQHIVIEANYDARMLSDGPYPMYLKARIAARNGHLDNAETARFLTEIYTPALRNIFLCHLSQDNNTPEQALATITERLATLPVTIIGADAPATPAQAPATLRLLPLPRYDASPLYTLR